MPDDREQRQTLGDKGMGGNEAGKMGKGTGSCWVARASEGIRQGKGGGGQDHVGWQGNGMGSGRDEGEGEWMHVLEGLRGVKEGGGGGGGAAECARGWRGREEEGAGRWVGACAYARTRANARASGESGCAHARAHARARACARAHVHAR